MMPLNLPVPTQNSECRRNTRVYLVFGVLSRDRASRTDRSVAPTTRLGRMFADARGQCRSRPLLDPDQRQRGRTKIQKFFLSRIWRLLRGDADTERDTMARFQKLAAFMLAIVATLYMQAAVAAPAAFPTGNITIEIWWHEYGPFTAYVKELIKAYKKVRPNVTVNPVIMSSGDINQKLTVALATGTGPDIMDQDASFYELYYTKGVLEPLNLDVFGVSSYEELAAKYTPGGLAAGTFGGKVYALPYQGNSMSLFISNKAFAAAGLDLVKDAPKTWEDVKALGPKLKKVQGNRTIQKAFEFPYHSPRWEMQCFQPLVEQYGGKILSDDGKTAYINSPEAAKALTLWRDGTKLT